MMTAAEYVSTIVEPTLEEFNRNRVDLRRGMIACMVVLHVVDFVMQNRAATPQAGNDAVEVFKKRTCPAHLSFDAVNRFALASKHAKLKNEPDFTTDKHRVFPATPFMMGLFPIGGDLVVEISEGKYVNLLSALRATMALYRTEFPEAFISEPVATPAP